MQPLMGQRVLLCRRDLDMNQDQLAELAEVSRTYISHLERGKIDNPTIAAVEGIARALQVRPEYLLGWTDDPTGESSPAGPHTIVHQAANGAERALIEELLDTFQELSKEDQALALQIIRQIGRSRGVRIIGEDDATSDDPRAA